MATTLRDGTEVDDRRLDRVEQFDPRSLDYRIAAAVSIAEPTTVLHTIPDGSPVLDQGQEGACVGFATTNELRFNPVPVAGLDAKFARENVYWAAQRIDSYAGGAYPGASPFSEGTSVLAGVKTATKLGYYTEYRWAKSEPEFALGVSQYGPGIIGVGWTEDMYKPNRAGFLIPTGERVGGHCLLVIGVNVEGGYYTLYNSWGPRWGNKGTAKIKRTDLAKLLKQRGDACVITGRTQPAVK